MRLKLLNRQSLVLVAVAAIVLTASSFPLKGEAQPRVVTVAAMTATEHPIPLRIPRANPCHWVCGLNRTRDRLACWQLRGLERQQCFQDADNQHQQCLADCSGS